MTVSYCLFLLHGVRGLAAPPLPGLKRSRVSGFVLMFCVSVRHGGVFADNGGAAADIDVKSPEAKTAWDQNKEKHVV